MKRIALVFVLAAGIALAGCTGSPGPVETTDPPVEVPSATPTPEAPVEVPADPATWVIDGDGVGPFDIGGAIVDVTAAVGSGMTDQSDTANCPWLGAFGIGDGGTVLARLDDATYQTVQLVDVTSDFGSPAPDPDRRRPRVSTSVRPRRTWSPSRGPLPDDFGRTVYRQDTSGAPIMYEVREASW